MTSGRSTVRGIVGIMPSVPSMAMEVSRSHLIIEVNLSIPAAPEAVSVSLSPTCCSAVYARHNSTQTPSRNHKTHSLNYNPSPKPLSAVGEPSGLL